MKMSIRFLLWVLIVSSISFSQEKEGEEDPGTIEIESDHDAAELSESIAQLREHPIAVIHPSYGDLSRIPSLSGRLAEAIIRFTDTVTVYDAEQLRSVDGMTEEQFTAIRPYIMVPAPAASLWNVQEVRLRNRNIQRMSRTDGFRSGVYDGGIPAIDHRFTMRTEALSFGAHLSKDAGERTQDGTRAFYLQWNGTGSIQRFIIGDFSVGFGEGLLLSRSMTSAKGTDVIGQAERSSATTLSPRLPSEEGMAMRGAAATVTIGGIGASFFRSTVPRTATLDSVSAVHSLDQDGLFRNTVGRSRRGNVRETTGGILVDVPVGTTLHFSSAWTSFHRDHSTSENASPSVGPVGIDAFSGAFRWSDGRMRTFGECTTANGDSWNGVGGLSFAFSKEWSTVLHLRSLSAGKLGPYAHPFMQGSSAAQRERGVYTGLEYHAGPVRCGTFLDQSYSDAAKDQYSGNTLDRLFFVEFHPIRSALIGIRFRHRVIEAGDPDPLSLPSTQQRIRFDITLSPIRHLRVSYRAEWSIIRSGPKNTETGFLTYADAAASFSFFALRSRLTLFDTPSYDSRIYATESDLPGMISAPAFYGRGVRWTVLISAELRDMLRGSIRYGRTWYPGVLSIGSGPDRIDGSRDDRIGVQLDFRI